MHEAASEGGYDQIRLPFRRGHLRQHGPIGAYVVSGQSALDFALCHLTHELNET